MVEPGPNNSLIWTPHCNHCRFVMKPVTIDLDAVLNPGTQCPRCLQVMDTGELGKAIDGLFNTVPGSPSMT